MQTAFKSIVIVRYNMFSNRKRTESDLTVKVGSIKFEGHDVESIGVTHIINHPDNVGFKNDIGLLRLSKPIKFSKTVGPICLPKTTLKEENLKSFRYCVMTGFGTMNRGLSFLDFNDSNELVCQ